MHAPQRMADVKMIVFTDVPTLIFLPELILSESRPPEAAAAVVKTGRNAGVLFRHSPRRPP